MVFILHYIFHIMHSVQSIQVRTVSKHRMRASIIPYYILTLIDKCTNPTPPCPARTVDHSKTTLARGSRSIVQQLMRSGMD